ncbi:MAG: Spy/CpxP family protein refolding chaperone [Gammaproteobacteria bacterium]
MKKLTTTLLITTLAIGGMTIAGTSLARHGDGYSHCGADGMQDGKHRSGHRDSFGHADRGFHAIRRLEKNLDLSTEQRTAVREIMQNARTARRAYRDILLDNRLALHDLMEAEDFDEQEARRLAEIQGDHMAELMVLRARTQADIRAQLTAEPREKLSGLHRERGFGHGFGRHR